MAIKCIVKRNEYRDSVVLMRIAKDVKRIAGIDEATLLIGTDNNKRILHSMGLPADEIANATPNDIIIVARAIDPELVEKAISTAEEMLIQKIAEPTETVYATFDAALDEMVGANFAIVSVPGEYAAREAEKAIGRGLNVLLFSDNVPIEDELKLKLMARGKGLFMMGPGCGTAIINGVGLGFANSVNKGGIGVIAAAGTGLQEFSVQVHRRGSGISQAIGTGGRDLSKKIGGIMMIEGIKRLQSDEQTKVIALISKQPSSDVSRKILELAKECRKPVVVNFVGADQSSISKFGAVHAYTIEDAAAKAVALERGGRARNTLFTFDRKIVESIVRSETSKLAREQKYVRGLFSGGTLCGEAIIILTELLGVVYSNISFSTVLRLKDSTSSKANACIDLGEEEFTLGRPHPMIDFDTRSRRLIQEASDFEVAVVLLDLVLGYGANRDPARAIGPTIRQAKSIAEKENRYLSVVASLCGTELRPTGSG